MPEELVNTASLPNLSIWFQRSRVNQPDPTFPQSPGIIFEISGAILFPPSVFGSFNELRTSYRFSHFLQRIDMHSLSTKTYLWKTSEQLKSAIPIKRFLLLSH